MRLHKKILFYVVPYILPKSKANLFIVGGQKCGTSSLFKSLANHKQINSSLFKEAHFFEKNYFLGLFWYDGLFFRFWFKKNIMYNMESSPNYIMYPEALERIYNYNQNAKLIFILRDRVDRAYSQYRHNKRFRLNEIKFDFENSLLNEKKTLISNPYNKNSKKYYEFRDKFNYIERSRYSPQLESLYKIFKSENVLILSYEKLFDETFSDSEYEKIGNFLKLNISGLKKKRAMVNISIKNDLNSEKRKSLEKKYFINDIAECENKFGISI